MSEHYEWVATFYEHSNFSGKKAPVYWTPEQHVYMAQEHPGFTAWSCKVAEGFKIVVRDGKKGDGVETGWLEAGDYPELKQYELIDKKDGKVTDVTGADSYWVVGMNRVDYSAAALSHAYYYSYGDGSPVHRIGPGNFPNLNESRYFPRMRGNQWDGNAQKRKVYMTQIYVPKWHTLRLYTKENYEGSKVSLTGPKTFDLRTYDMAAFGDPDKMFAKSAKIFPDEVEIIDYEIDDSNASSEVTLGQSASAVAINTSSDVGEPMEGDPLGGAIISLHSLAISHDVAVETNYEKVLSFEESVMVGVQAKAAFAPLGVGGDITGSLDAGLVFTQSYGTGGSNTDTVTYTAEVDVILGRKKGAALTLQFKEVKVTDAVVRRTWQNTRTKETFTDEATLDLSTVLDVVQKVTPISDEDVHKIDETTGGPTVDQIITPDDDTTEKVADA